MKIGYITKEDPNDVRAYSGTHYSMYQVLKNEFEEVIPLGPIDHWYKNVAKLKGRVKTFRNDKVFKFQYDLKLAKHHAKQLDKKIEKIKPDILLGSLVSPEVAFLETKIPLYLTTDATFPLLQDLYKSHSNLYAESIKNALILERMAFNKAEKLLFPLEWLSNSAQKHYRIQKDNIEVIPYGSNLISSLNKEVEDFIISRTKLREINLLFVGVRWEEKGGPEAVKITELLNQIGINARLTIIGCEPEIDLDFVEVIGFLDKQNPNELARLIKLYQKASFFILPTKAECVGMSFIEAASYGLPAIGTKVGGVPEAVLDKKTGLIFDVNEDPKTIAYRIQEIWNDESLYQEISKFAFQHYSNELNWTHWAKRVKAIITNK